MCDRMKNPSAIVTGGTRGIGRAITLRLIQNGVKVVANYLRRHDAAEATKTRVEELGGEIHLVRGDIGNEETARRIVDTAQRAFGTVTYFVSNASHYKPRSILEMEASDIDRYYIVNVRGPLLVCRLLWPMMKDQQYGKIVFISSALARSGYGRSADYVAAKAALLGLTKSLAIEMAPHVRVNALLPGLIGTDRLQSEDAAETRQRIRQIAVGRLGRPEEVAEMAAFILSEKCDYISGETIGITGGWDPANTGPQKSH